MEFTAILFYLFSAAVVISAVLVISSRNPVHSVLWLIFAFFNSAGLFILLGAEMLAMLLVIVYVGAVAVLFLFVVMMLNIKTEQVKKGFQAHLPIGLLFAVILFAELVMIIGNSNHKIDLTKESQIPLTELADNTNVKTVEKTEKKVVTKTVKGKKTQKTEEKTVVTEAVEDKAPADVTIETAADESGDNVEKEKPVLTNAEAIGHVLYTEYVLYFEFSGLILLVAMIGAIVLTLRHREGVRRQKISEQVNRKRSDSIKIVSVETGKGAE